MLSALLQRRRTMVSRVRRVAALWVFLFLATSAVASAAGTDVVTTLTGEKIVGEIVKVEKDVLTIETAYSDSDFKVKWDQIAHRSRVAADSWWRHSPAAAYPAS
jgi:hypothetical protein